MILSCVRAQCLDRAVDGGMVSIKIDVRSSHVHKMRQRKQLGLLVKVSVRRRLLNPASKRRGDLSVICFFMFESAISEC